MRLALLTVWLILSIAALSNAQPSEVSRAGTPSISGSARAKAVAASAEPSDRRAAGTLRSSTGSQDREAATRTRLQLGVSLKGTMTPGIDTNNSVNPTFVWRWRGKGSRVDDRWAPAYRLSSFGSRVSSQLGSREMAVGDVKLRPLMLGLDYKMPRGKWNWATGMSAGWALNNIETRWEYRARAFDAAGVADLWVDVHNSFVWGPRLKGWYDMNRRLSLMVESAYLVTRPRLDVRAHGIVSTRRLNADAFIVKAGFVYGIF